MAARPARRPDFAGRPKAATALADIDRSGAAKRTLVQLPDDRESRRLTRQNALPSGVAAQLQPVCRRASEQVQHAPRTDRCAEDENEPSNKNPAEA